jgi:putative hemolysin
VLIHHLAYAVAIAGSIAAVAFFASSEISFVSSNKFRIRGLVRRGVKGAAIAQGLLDHPATLLSVTLVGTNIFVVLVSSLMTDLLTRSLGPYSVVVSTVAATSLILVFGEIIPKAIARNQPEVFLLKAAPGMAAAYYVLYPVARVTSWIAGAFVRLSRPVDRVGAVTREEIRALVKEAAQARSGLLSQAYAHRVLDLSRMKVTAAMMPMDEVTRISEESSVNDALSLASKTGHSRCPVYKRTPDNIVGILHVKDLLGVPREARIRIFARSVFFIPETKSLKDALREMRDELRHLAVIDDEYGRPIGIVTFEDLMEEIMGEISDEYDRVVREPVRLDQVISGSTPVSTINEELGADIPDGAYDTVAGFMLDQAGALCQVGDIIEFGDFRFHVVEVRGKRIRKVRITKVQ